MAYVPHTDAQLADMLKAIGVEKFDDLIKAIPEEVRLKDGFDVPEGLSEFEVTKKIEELGEKNRKAIEAVNFLGGGSYDHYIAAGVGAMLSRAEWYTAYTPYQPEVSQGTLQAIFEYQSVICNMTGMDVSNASVYDGATASTEAMLLALRAQKKRSKILVSDGLHPHYQKLMQTYADTSDIDIQKVPLGEDGKTDINALKEALNDDVAVFHFAQPNFFGVLEDAEEIVETLHAAKVLAAVSVYPISLGKITPPSEYGADIVTGEGQCLGNAMGFGGPYLGVFATTKKLMRQIPGRIAGETVDKDGERGFVLTLQTREQHIRRNKATSNICTNQGLNALAAVVHVALIGKEGFKQVADLCYHKAHYLAEKIKSETKFELAFDSPFFNEFTIKSPVPAKEAIDKIAKNGILAGIRLARFYPEMEDRILIAVTEKRTKAEMDSLVEELKKF